MIFENFCLLMNSTLNLKVDESACQKLKLFTKELQNWNRLFNLTALEKNEEIYEKHFYDSLLPLKYVDLTNQSIIDVGSGAGFPGLVIAILVKEAKVTLLEPNKKKAHFLQTMVEKLELNNTSVINGRAETQNKLRETFDFAIARAVKPLNILLELVIPLLKVGGTFIAMKGKKAQEEINEARKAFAKLKCKINFRYEDVLPSSLSQRVNLFIVKNDITPIRYPRSYNLIATKPL